MTLDDYLSGNRSLRRLMAGPLKEGIGLYADRLRRDGYGGDHAYRALSILTRFAQWLSDNCLDIRDIDERRVQLFMQKTPLRGGDRKALCRLIDVLRDAGIIPLATPPVQTPREQILDGFRQYLQRRIGLNANSSENNIRLVHRMLDELLVNGPGDLHNLAARDVTRYVERHVDDHSPGTAKRFCSSLRSFLRYIFVEELVDIDLSGCIPSIRRYSQTNLPTYLSSQQVEQVLQNCDRTTTVGKRNYAVLMLLARLGLRSKEIVSLTLDDIDWKAAHFLVNGKGQCRAIMPLPYDVGEALSAYLANGRPASDCREVFLRARAPYRGLSNGSAISEVARKAIEHAGINHLGHRGAHVFRHSLATGLLQSGVTLTQIGQVLRHKHHDTTRIYAKVDLASLRTISVPWPECGQ